MAVIIDPAVRIIGDQNQIFVLHPGRNKRFARDFTDFSAVFLDIPGISFPKKPDKASEALQNQLRMSRRIRAWRNAGAKKEDAPSRKPDDYKISGSSKNSRFVNEVDDLYADAKAGDLVVVPGKGYGKTMLIGEFTNDFDPDFTVFPARYRGEKVPARRVNWLRIEASKTEFSARLIKLLQNRQAIIRISNTDDRHEVYERAYGDYIWEGTSGNLLRVTKEDIDLHDLSGAVNLTNFFAAQYLALKAGKLEHFLSLDFHDAIEEYYDRSYFGGVQVEIHSPGFFGRTMRKAELAGYVSVMLALSATGITAQDAALSVVHNSSNTTVSICDVELEKDVRETMEMYANLNLWENKICPARKRTQETVGLTTDVNVTESRDGHAPTSAAETYNQQVGDLEADQ
ncbi:hypothetical protein ACSSV1_004057 [Labrenzia sp. MBR-25]